MRGLFPTRSDSLPGAHPVHAWAALVLGNGPRHALLPAPGDGSAGILRRRVQGHPHCAHRPGWLPAQARLLQHVGRDLFIIYIATLRYRFSFITHRYSIDSLVDLRCSYTPQVPAVRAGGESADRRLRVDGARPARGAAAALHRARRVHLRLPLGRSLSQTLSLHPLS